MTKSKPISFIRSGHGKPYVTVDLKLFEKKFGDKNIKHEIVSARKRKGLSENKYKEFDLIRKLAKKKCKNCCMCGICGLY